MISIGLFILHRIIMKIRERSGLGQRVGLDNKSKYVCQFMHQQHHNVLAMKSKVGPEMCEVFQPC